MCIHTHTFMSETQKTNQPLHAVSWARSTCSSPTNARASPVCVSILAASLTLTRSEVCVTNSFCTPQPGSRDDCSSPRLLPFLLLHARSPSCFHLSHLVIYSSRIDLPFIYLFLAFEVRLVCLSSCLSVCVCVCVCFAGELVSVRLPP